jgi:hypothetical protein
MDLIIALPLAAVIGFIGWYVHTSHLAYIDGVRNHHVFQAAWWPCMKASDVRLKLAMLETMIKTHTEQEELDIKMFALDCAVVVSNNIRRRHPNVVLNIQIDDTPFETYVNTFNQKHKRSTAK